MSARTLHLQIVSPLKSEFEGPVSLVEIPGIEGDFGVLPDHAPFLSMLKPGIVTISQKEDELRYFVSSGYAEVSPEGCVVLSEQVQNLDNCSRAEVETRIAAARQALTEAKGEAAKIEAAQKLAFAEALLAVV
jgi:F-type H+-transporting ATPase subunit epsilon